MVALQIINFVCTVRDIYVGVFSNIFVTYTYIYICLKVYFSKIRRQSAQAILCALVAISVGRIYIMVAECFYIKTKDTHDDPLLKRDRTHEMK